MTEDWSQKFQPQTEKDILISKTIYTQIRTFFTLNFKDNQNNRNTKSLLFLFGPSGCGKRSTIDFLCDDFQVALATPDNLQIEDNNEKENFQDWEKDADYIKDLVKIFSVAASWYNSKKKVVLVVNDLPEVPNFVKKKRLDDLIHFYLSKDLRMPIIFSLNSNFYNESKVKRLFSEGVVQNSSIVIRMKEYTDAAMKKAIKSLGEKEPALQRCDLDLLRDEIVLKCHGDLKQALNQLYMISLKYKGTKERKIRKIKSSQSSQRSLMAENSRSFEMLDNVPLKDREFTLFHTLGKFLYNKRVDPNGKEPRIFSSTELMAHQPPFYFDPAHMVSQLNMDLSLFVLFLHENYLDFYGEIEDVVEMSNVFAENDVFRNFNFKVERNEVQNYHNEFLNTTITANAIMLHNLTGGDRLLAEKSTERSHKGLKTFSKPKLLGFRSEYKNNVQNIKGEMKNLTIPFHLMVTEYMDFVKPEDPLLKRRRFLNAMFKTKSIDEDERFLDLENPEESNTSAMFYSLSQFSVEEKGPSIVKGAAPINRFEDDIEEVDV